MGAVVFPLLKKQQSVLSVQVFRLSAVHGVFLWHRCADSRAVHSPSHHPLSRLAKRMLTCIWWKVPLWECGKKPHFWFIMHRGWIIQAKVIISHSRAFSSTFITLSVAKLLWILRPLDTHHTEGALLFRTKVNKLQMGLWLLMIKMSYIWIPGRGASPDQHLICSP